MPDIRHQHLQHLMHHVEQGAAWLQASDGGKNTAALSYSALEFRFAIERLAVHYWTMLLDRRPTDADLKTIKSFKSLERAIFDLAGHQAQINGHFAFMRIMLDLVQAKVPMHTPNIGQLSKYWHTCSTMCHVGWVLVSTLAEVQSEASRALTDVCKVLSDHVKTASVWPDISHPPLVALRDRFIAGKAAESEVRDALAKEGLWAESEHADGRLEFVGKAVPPTQPPPAQP